LEVNRLTCAECAATSPPGARGWRPLLGYDLRGDDSPEAFVFCLDAGLTW
jgi:hypothetical protein